MKGGRSMDCQLVQEKLSQYLDGELLTSEIQLIKEHLRTCTRCQTELSSLEQTVNLVRQMEPMVIPSGLKDEIWTQIESEPSPSFSIKTRRLVPPWPQNWGHWARSLSTVVAVLLDVVLVGKTIILGLTTNFKSADDYSSPSEEAGGVWSQSEEFSTDRMTMVEKLAPLLGQQNVESLVTTTRKIIRTAHLTLIIETLDVAAPALEDVVKRNEGFVQDSNISRYSDGREARYTLRVPAVRLDQVLVQLETLGEVRDKGTSAEDITEEYIDVAARQRNLLRQEERLLTILDQAATVEDILQVENQLERVRGEIELLTGRLRYLDNRVILSTINVELRERPRSVTTVQLPINNAFGSQLKESFTGSINLLLSYFSSAIVWSVAALPFLLVGTGIGALGWFLFLRFRKKR
jgi:hypothetical protein